MLFFVWLVECCQICIANSIRVICFGMLTQKGSREDPKQELGPIVQWSTQTHGKKYSGCKYRLSKCELEFFTVISLCWMGTQHSATLQDIALHFCFESSACPDDRISAFLLIIVYLCQLLLSTVKMVSEENVLRAVDCKIFQLSLHTKAVVCQMFIQFPSMLIHKTSFSWKWKDSRRGILK